MVRVAITHEEVASGKISLEHLEAAVGAIRREGFVVLEGVVNLGHLEVLREKLLEDIAALVGREDAPFKRSGGFGMPQICERCLFASTAQPAPDSRGLDSRCTPAVHCQQTS